MAKEKWFVGFDLEAEGQYDNVSLKKGTTATTLNSEEPIAANGLRGQVFNAKVSTVEAESAEEAMKFAGEAYGSKTSMAVAAKSSNVEFKNA